MIFQSLAVVASEKFPSWKKLRFVGFSISLLRASRVYKYNYIYYIGTYVIIYLQRAIHSSQVSPPIRHFGKDVFGDLGHVFANIMQFMSSEQFWAHNLAFCSLFNCLTAAADSAQSGSTVI